MQWPTVQYRPFQTIKLIIKQYVYLPIPYKIWLQKCLHPSICMKRIEIILDAVLTNVVQLRLIDNDKMPMYIDSLISHRFWKNRKKN